MGGRSKAVLREARAGRTFFGAQARDLHDRERRKITTMMKRLLIALGLRSAPPPLRTYLAASSFVGVLPALAFVAWKYRGKIAPMLHRASRQPEPAM